jgi:predicted PurR-regulated permease PerM
MVIKKIKRAAKVAKKKYNEIILEAQTDKNTKQREVSYPTPPKNENQTFTFSISNVTKILLVALLLIIMKDFFAEISDIIILFLVSLLFAAALDPTVDKLEEYKIPRGISAGTILMLLIGVLCLFIYSMIPLLSAQLSDLGGKIGILFENLSSGNLKVPNFIQPFVAEIASELEGVNFSSTIQTQLLNYSKELSGLAGNFFETLKSISSGLSNFLFVLVLTYFMTVEEQEIDKFLLRVSPNKYGTYITAKINNIKQKVGEWLRGQIILMVVVGAFTYVGLLLLGTDYAFTLALIAGVTELIPVVGPWIGLIAAIPVAINQGGSMLLWVTILYFIIQRLENNLFVPIIMKKATGLNPVVVILAMLIGNKFLGIIGIIISIPLAAILSIFLEDILSKKEQTETISSSKQNS